MALPRDPNNSIVFEMNRRHENHPQPHEYTQVLFVRMWVDRAPGYLSPLIYLYKNKQIQEVESILV